MATSKKKIKKTLESRGYNDVHKYIDLGLQEKRNVLVVNITEDGYQRETVQETFSRSKSGSREIRSCREYIENCKDPKKLENLVTQCLAGNTNDHAALLVGIVARLQELRSLKYTKSYLKKFNSDSSIMQECLENLRQEISLQEVRALSQKRFKQTLQGSRSGIMLYVAKERLSHADLKQLVGNLSVTSKEEVRKVARNQQAMRKAVNRYCISMGPKEKAAAKNQQRKKDKQIAAKVKPKKGKGNPGKKALLGPNAEKNPFRKAATQGLVARKVVPLTNAAREKAIVSLQALKNTELAVSLEGSNKLHSVSSEALITYAEKLFGSRDPIDEKVSEEAISFDFFRSIGSNFNRDSLVLYCNQLGIELSDELEDRLSFAEDTKPMQFKDFEIKANAEALKEVFDLISEKLITRLDKSVMEEDAKAKRMEKGEKEKSAFLAITNNPELFQEEKARLLVGSNLFQRIMKLHQGLIKKGSYPTISYKAKDGKCYQLSFSGAMNEKTGLPIFEINELDPQIRGDIQVMLGDKVLDEEYLFAPNLVDEDVASVLMGNSYDSNRRPIFDANDLMFSHLSGMTTSFAGRVKDESYKNNLPFALSDDAGLASMVFKGGKLDTKNNKYKGSQGSSAYVVVDGKLQIFDHYKGLSDARGVANFHSLGKGVVSAAGALCAVEREGTTYMFLDISSGHMKGSDIDAAVMAVSDAMVAEGVDREKIVIYTGRDFAGIAEESFDEVNDATRADLENIAQQGGTTKLNTQELARILNLPLSTNAQTANQQGGRNPYYQSFVGFEEALETVRSEYQRKHGGFNRSLKHYQWMHDIVNNSSLPDTVTEDSLRDWFNLQEEPLTPELETILSIAVEAQGNPKVVNTFSDCVLELKNKLLPHDPSGLVAPTASAAASIAGVTQQKNRVNATNGYFLGPQSIGPLIPPWLRWRHPSPEAFYGKGLSQLGGGYGIPPQHFSMSLFSQQKMPGRWPLPAFPFHAPPTQMARPPRIRAKIGPARPQ